MSDRLLRRVRARQPEMSRGSLSSLSFSRIVAVGTGARTRPCRCGRRSPLFGFLLGEVHRERPVLDCPLGTTPNDVMWTAGTFASV